MTGFTNNNKFTVRGERGEALPIALDLIGQSAFAAIEAMIESQDVNVAKKGLQLMEQVDTKYGGLEGLVADPQAMSQLATVIQSAVAYDEGIGLYADTLNTSIQDGGTSDEEYARMIEQGQNSEQPTTEWVSRKSNVDGNQYMVHNESGEYLSMEDYQNSNSYTAPDSMGWDGDEGGESSGLQDK